MRLTPADTVGFRARLTDIQLNRMELLAARENVSRMASVSAPADKILIVFPETDKGMHYWADRRLGLGELVIVFKAAHGTWRVCAPTRWGAILLPTQMLTDWLCTFAGERAHLPPPGLTPLRPRWRSFRELLKLHRAAVRYTVHQPEASVETDAARGLEQELLTSLVGALTDMATKGD